MFAKLAIFIASVAVFAAATPLPGGASGIHDSCNTGSVQCCNSVQDAKSAQVTQIAALLGIVLGDATGQAGLNCSPITAGGLSGNSCNAQPTCCEGNNYNGLIVIGCTPININA